MKDKQSLFFNPKEVANFNNVVWKKLAKTWFKRTEQRIDITFFDPKTLYFIWNHATPTQKVRIENLVCKKFNDNFSRADGLVVYDLGYRKSTEKWLREIQQCSGLPKSIRAAAGSHIGHNSSNR